MIKAATLAFDGSVLDCALMDASPNGARAHLMTSIDVPDISTLSLRTGESWTVRRRWQNGVQVGFEIVDAAVSATAA